MYEISMSTKAKIITIILVAIVLIAVAFLALGAFALHQRSQPYPVVLRCQTRLSHLGAAILIYATDHNDNFPQNLDTLANYSDGERPFVCPGSGVEYVLVQGRTFSMPLNSILAYCPDRHHVYGAGDELGINILILASEVQTIKMDEVNELFAEQGMNLNAIDAPHNKPLQ